MDWHCHAIYLDYSILLPFYRWLESKTLDLDLILDSICVVVTSSCLLSIHFLLTKIVFISFLFLILLFNYSCLHLPTTSPTPHPFPPPSPLFPPLLVLFIVTFILAPENLSPLFPHDLPPLPSDYCCIAFNFNVSQLCCWIRSRILIFF